MSHVAAFGLGSSNITRGSNVHLFYCSMPKGHNYSFYYTTKLNTAGIAKSCFSNSKELRVGIKISSILIHSFPSVDLDFVNSEDFLTTWAIFHSPKRERNDVEGFSDIVFGKKKQRKKANYFCPSVIFACVGFQNAVHINLSS